VGDEEYPN
jgi:hypothetical protein